MHLAYLTGDRKNFINESHSIDFPSHQPLTNEPLNLLTRLVHGL